MAKIGMIGAGSWGTALTWLLTNNGHQVTVWSALADEITMLQEKHEQTSKLPGVILDDSVVFTTDLKAAVEGMDLLVLAVPSPFTRSTAKPLQFHRALCRGRHARADHGLCQLRCLPRHRL